MDAKTVAQTTPILEQTDVSQAVRSLAEAMKAAPEFQAILQAARAVHSDDTVQDLLRQIRIRQAGLGWGQDDRADHARPLRELQAELEAQPAVRAYRQAEQAARELLQAVDAVIGEMAGVEFAANAKRSCCGG
jgi:cell fate (sporulation/competence/biofilm development) regulator YlbF (YheA/YmcA/DUF963 family)